MKLEFLWKDAESYTGNCPAVYRAKHNGRSGFAFQGPEVGGEDAAQFVDLGDGEKVIWVPDNVVYRIPGLAS